jgi:hypothetical protein
MERSFLLRLSFCMFDLQNNVLNLALRFVEIIPNSQENQIETYRFPQK